MVAMARASSTSRARPVGRESVGSSARSRIPTWARRRSVTPAGDIPAGKRRRWVSAAIWTFSRAVRVSNSSRRWKVRAIPLRARTWGEALVMSRAVEPDPAPGGGLEAGDDIEQCGLAGPVGPDEPVDGAGPDGHVHLVQGLDAAEADGDLLAPRGQPTELTSASMAPLGAGRRVVADRGAGGRGALLAVVRHHDVELPDPDGVASDGHDARADQELREVQQTDVGGDDGEDGDEYPGGDGPGEHAHASEGHPGEDQDAERNWNCEAPTEVLSPP